MRQQFVDSGHAAERNSQRHFCPALGNRAPWSPSAPPAGGHPAPALAEATVGVARGAAGIDVALEMADVALMADDLEKLVYALRLVRRKQTVVLQNLMLSALVIDLLVIGAIGRGFSFPFAMLGHEISEFVVIASGLRMLST